MRTDSALVKKEKLDVIDGLFDTTYDAYLATNSNSVENLLALALLRFRRDQYIPPRIGADLDFDLAHDIRSYQTSSYTQQENFGGEIETRTILNVKMQLGDKRVKISMKAVDNNTEYSAVLDTLDGQGNLLETDVTETLRKVIDEVDPVVTEHFHALAANHLRESPMMLPG